jgi:tetratricopeptide (TPR) repeat protein
VDAGKFDEAAATFAQVADNEALPDDVRDDAKLSTIQVKLQAGKYEEARDQLKELQGSLKAGSRFSARAKVAEAECLVAETKKYQQKDDPARVKLFTQAVDLVRGVIKESNDKYVKAVGHNTLGYCYMEQGQTKDAVWEFLWVDVVYNQDRMQHGKALYHLWDLFTKDGDAPRAQECREALMAPQFTGTEYQRLVKDAKAP